jgi:2-hydroxy-3-oxopropionate reductase
MGLSLPNTANTQQLMSSCVAHGGAAWDHSGIVRALEMAANFQISPNPTPAA